MPKNPKYLQLRDGRYYARIVIPPALRPFLAGATELREPLGADRRSATANIEHAVSSMKQKIARARAQLEQQAGTRTRSQFKPIPEEQIAYRRFRELEELDAFFRKSDPRYGAHYFPPEDWVEDLRKAIAGSMTNAELQSMVGKTIDQARLQGEHDHEFGSFEWRSLAMTICVAELEACSLQALRYDLIHDAKTENEILAKGQELEITASSARPAFSVSFQDIIDQERNRRASGKDAKPMVPATYKKYSRISKEFADFRGSDEASTITVEEVEQWIADLQRQGANTNNTIGQKAEALVTIIEWGRKAHRSKFFADRHPLAGMRKPEFQGVASHKKVMTEAEVETVLRKARTESDPMLRWLPFIGAYTGARVSEIGNLEKENIFEHNGHWFIEFDTAGGKSLKTQSSRRRVPIHPALVEEGFLDFLKVMPPGRLFRGKTKTDIQVQPRMSEWLRELIPYSQRPELQPNHSWRHRWEDIARRDGLDLEARSYIAGRAFQGSHSLYGGSDVMLDGLYREICKIKKVKL